MNLYIVRPQNRGRIAALLLHHRYLMGDRRRVNLPLVGFKPDPIVVRSDSQSGDVIQELVQRGELHWIHLLGKFRANVEAIFDDPRSHRRRSGRAGGHDEAA